MYTYKRIIKCPNSIEIEVYHTIRKPGKNYGGRGVNRNLSTEKQKIANKKRTTKKWERLIDCNFNDKGWFCRFSAPFGIFDSEEKLMREFRNFSERIKRRCKKEKIQFKYLGFRECGKLGKNWHLHIVLSNEVMKIAKECWKFKNGGMNFTPLYEYGNFEKLADYIHKDVCGKKRIMASRNLKRPEISVCRASKKEIKQLEQGEILEPPQGYYLSKDDFEYYINDITGASFYFKFKPLTKNHNLNKGIEEKAFL